MKKIFAFFFAALLLLPFKTFAEERIRCYDVDIHVNADSTINVVETIRIVAEGRNVRLGIYRDVPQSYMLGNKKVKTPVNVLGVYKNGAPENFWTEKHGNDLRILIGPKNDTPGNRLKVPGEYEYKIVWESQGHIRFFETFDELYFNVTGNGWNFAIEDASARVFLPPNVEVKQISAYRGYEGSADPAEGITVNPHQVDFSAGSRMAPNQGLTVAVGFSKGLPQPPEPPRPFLMKTAGHVMEFLPFLSETAAVFLIVFGATVLYYMIFWFIYGKDDDLGPITPLFAPPKNVSPAEAAALWHGKNAAQDTALSATLVNLAAGGFMTLSEKKFEKKEREGEPAFPEERALLKELFFRGENSFSFGSYSPKVQQTVEPYFHSLKDYVKKHVATNNRLIAIGVFVPLILLLFGTENLSFLAFAGLTWLIGLFYSPFFMAAINLMKAKSYVGGLAMLAFIIPHSLVFLLVFPAVFSGVDPEFSWAFFFQEIIVISFVPLHVLFYYLMDKPLPHAVPLIRDLAGLKMFLTATEANVYQKMTPSVFEKNLPYAIVFGVEQKWVEKFRSMYPTYRSEWQSGGPVTSSFLHRMSRNVAASRTPPRSSRSGGGFSGSSGGGSSGGGSGGGGGGGR